MQYAELLARVQKDYAGLKFRAGKRFCFRPPRTVVYEQFCDVGAEAEQKKANSLPQAVAEAGGVRPNGAQNEQNLQLLHEVGHALLGHRDFRTDVERVRMECVAWVKAKELAEEYQVDYDEEFVEAELDTYRDWLYRRARCRKCGATKYQDNGGGYHCPMCEAFG